MSACHAGRLRRHLGRARRGHRALGRAWGAVRHLNAVMDTPELRAAYTTENLPRITGVPHPHGRGRAPLRQYQAIPAAPQNRLERRRGACAVQRGARLRALRRRAAGEARRASRRSRSARPSCRAAFRTRARRHRRLRALRQRAELDGVPADVPGRRAAAQTEGLEGCKLTLHFPSYFPVMQYAQPRPAREALHGLRDPRQRARPAALDNGRLDARAAALRQEEALLGSKASFAEVSLAKMAESPQQVIAFLRDLAARAAGAERDLAELREFARADSASPICRPGTWPRRRAPEGEALRLQRPGDQAYFVQERVLDGLFRIVETLFRCASAPDEAPVEHRACASSASSGWLPAATPHRS